MCGLAASSTDTENARTSRESLRERHGELVFDRGTFPRVPVVVSREHVIVGCHTLTKDAWKLLVKLVERKS